MLNSCATTTDEIRGRERQGVEDWGPWVDTGLCSCYQWGGAKRRMGVRITSQRVPQGISGEVVESMGHIFIDLGSGSVLILLIFLGHEVSIVNHLLV